MTVYVDDMDRPYGRMIMSHMMADSVEELHRMADKIGVARRHFQNHGLPHYDICKSKKAIALQNGAQLIKYGGSKQKQLIRKQRNGC